MSQFLLENGIFSNKIHKKLKKLISIIKINKRILYFFLARQILRKHTFNIKFQNKDMLTYIFYFIYNMLLSYFNHKQTLIKKKKISDPNGLLSGIIVHLVGWSWTTSAKI